ncbi:MAG: peptidase M75 [Muribaculaceae bacterium]|nr:peptidase M75 [Muribaculaceae bacterium]
MNIKSLIKKSVVALSMATVLLSCSDSKNNDEPNDGSTSAEKKAIVSQYVNKVVVPTYKSLADASLELANICADLKENPSQENVKKACDKWIEARKYWELTEAFLYGAANDYNIDPHIDSWPLQKSKLDQTLSNADLIAELDADGAAADGFASLGYGLLGFHAVEYVIFRDGQPRNVNDITPNELIYNAAVAEDLAWQTVRLEAAWAGVDNVTVEKQKLLKDNELEPTANYGEMMILAGEKGNSKYKTQIAAMVQMLQGASDISDEVGNTKITDPVNSGNVLDVESWYSWNSIDDFTDNIRSVRNVYYGSLDGSVHANSVSAYLKKLNSSADSKVRAAIDNALKEVASMPAPFRNHLTAAETKKAVEACNELMDALDNAITEIQK